jgi:hypothetical protein
MHKDEACSWAWWLKLVILDTQELKIRESWFEVIPG